MLSGGHLKDIPLPHRRQWPGESRKRGLSASIGKYYGIGIHFWPSLHQEDNPIWDPRTNAQDKPCFAGTDYGNEIIGWHLAWDDKEGMGLNVAPGRMDGDESPNCFDTPTQAIAWVEWAWHTYFPDHELYGSGGTLWEEYKADLLETQIAEGQFFYGKEGD